MAGMAGVCRKAGKHCRHKDDDDYRLPKISATVHRSLRDRVADP
jgi:hypothetical protein